MQTGGALSRIISSCNTTAALTLMRSAGYVAAFALLFFLSNGTCLAANTLAVFPCPSKPQPGKDCLAQTTASGESLVISNSDYYDVSIESVCIDQPDSWWKKKVISMSATLTLGTEKPLTTSIYQDRARGGGCRIGVNGYMLYSSIPSNGVPINIQVGVIRSNEQNGLRQILAFATKEQNNTALSTYAKTAVPFVQLALGFANDLYSAFGETSVPELPMSATGLHPASNVHPDRFDLRDGYLVEYSGNDLPQDGDFYVDSGELKWTKNDSPVRNGAVWVLLKIQRHTERTDYPTRNWYIAWENLLDDVRSRKPIDSKTYKSRNQDCVTLLGADQDYTFGDKNKYIDAFNKIQDKILPELDKTNPNYQTISDAIDSAMEDIQPIGKKSDGTVVTATNTKGPTEVVGRNFALPVVIPPGQQPPPPPPPEIHKAIVPSKLVEALQQRLQ